MKFSLDTSKLEKRLTDMQEKLRELGQVQLGQELKDWQSEDMHRKRPRTRIWARGKRASTIIRPHSIAEMKHSRKAAARATRRKSGWGPRQHTSTRPILRPVLYERLETRMRELLEKIKW
jgi:hypothetical protein